MMKKPIEHGIWLVLILVLFFSGCMSRDTQKKNTVSNNNYYLYVANQVNVSAFKIDIFTGLLTPVPGSPFPGVNLPSGNRGGDSMAADPLGRFLYVAESTNSPKISVYAIDSDTGALEFIQTFPSNNPNSIIVEPHGKYVYTVNYNYITNYGSGSLTQYRILEPSGELVVANNMDSISLLDDDIKGNYITIDPSGKYVYISNRPTNKVVQFQISDNGILIKNSVYQFQSDNKTMDWVTMDPAGRFVYVMDSDAADFSEKNIFKMSIGNSGELIDTNEGGMTGSAANCMLLAPNAPYVYVTLQNGSIRSFRITDTDLIPAPVDWSSGGSNPRGIAIDPTGRYLYAANSGSKTISASKIKNDGTLEGIKDPTTPDIYGEADTIGTKPAAIIIVKAQKLIQ